VTSECRFSWLERALLPSICVDSSVCCVCVNCSVCIDCSPSDFGASLYLIEKGAVTLYFGWFFCMVCMHELFCIYWLFCRRPRSVALLDWKGRCYARLTWGGGVEDCRARMFLRWSCVCGELCYRSVMCCSVVQCVAVWCSMVRGGTMCCRKWSKDALLGIMCLWRIVLQVCVVL